jgi:starch synthase
MRICYVLLSPTWGMHQYTADLANRQHAAGAEVHLITTRHAPNGQYAPGVAVHTPVATRDRGFSLDGLRPRGLGGLLGVLRGVEPDVVHVTGPHLWNPLLLHFLQRAKVPTVHTLHDLHPHTGASYGRLLYVWNRWIRRQADHLLVHGQCHREELLGQGQSPSRVTYTPLTHLFVSYVMERRLAQEPLDVQYEPWALFLGRFERYKGLDVLVEAARRLSDNRLKVVIAGPGRLEAFVQERVPPNVEVHAGLLGDGEAVDLFRRCGLVVLPYVEASQSALVAAATFFRKPVVATRTGALPEYVEEGKTGWLIPPRDPQALADVLAAGLGDGSRLEKMGEASRRWYDRQRRVEESVLAEMYARLERKSR